ncbi:MAG: hypothetical protein FI725_04100 [SAR202 cluster bacterium]|nr:hypothetical protein [SAR202 cluster bacterium]|tara:strand:- start:9144 stop:9689 length:546 start_codon:yes stop_codon:yes gene_type:complete
MWAIRIYTLIIATSLISIATFASLLFNTITVQANGVGTTHLQDEAVGPYLVTLKTSPAQLTVGTIRASLLIRSSETNEPLSASEATVTITGKTVSQSDEKGPFNSFVKEGVTPPHHDVDILLDKIGVWLLTVEINGELGLGEVVIPITIVKLSFTPLIILSGLVTVAAIVGVSYIRLVRRT